MPADDLGNLATAFGIVAAGAVPVAGVAAVAARTLGRPVLPPWQTGPERRTGGELVFVFLFNIVLVSLLVAVLQTAGFFREVYGPDFPDPLPPGDLSVDAVEAAMQAALTVRVVWASVFAVPVLFAVVGVAGVLANRRPALHPRDLPGRVALGVAAWLVLTPVVFAVHGLTQLVTAGLGGEPDTHPLTRLGVGDSAFDRALFAVAVCVAAPLSEELLFRGLLVRWAAGRWYRPGIVAVAAVILAAKVGTGSRSPAVGFAVGLLLGVVLIRGFGRKFGRRFPARAAGVWAAAAVFAAAHAAVWPTPVPLFVLGLGLGYLALRTRGIAASVVAHGLFNAVSFVYLLRGGPG